VKPLADDLQDLLDAERDIDVPAPAQRERMFAKLEPLIIPAAIGTGALAATASASATAEAAASAGASAVIGGALRAKLIASVMTAAVVGGAVGAAGHAYFAAPPPPPAAPAAPVNLAPIPPPSPTPVEPAPSAAPEPAPPPASAAAPTSSAPRSEERARSAGSLRAERLLIETASSALMRGDHASAVAALRQHARTFPRGDLAEEREVLLVKALAASGDDAAAKRRAKDFKSKFPGSVQQDSVDKAARPK
jgi:hypothetical protein